MRVKLEPVVMIDELFELLTVLGGDLGAVDVDSVLWLHVVGIGSGVRVVWVWIEASE